MACLHPNMSLSLPAALDRGEPLTAPAWRETLGLLLAITDCP